MGVTTFDPDDDGLDVDPLTGAVTSFDPDDERAVDVDDDGYTDEEATWC